MKSLAYAFTLILFCSGQMFGQDKIEVLCSASMLTDMAENIVGDLGEVQTIVPIGGDPHIYEATPRDAQKVKNAAIIFINGLTFEGWINELIENSGTTATTYTVTEGIDVIASSQYDNSYDPHAWMDVSNAIIYARNMKKALVEKFPKVASAIEANHANYEVKLKELNSYVQNEINKIPAEQRILITSHDAFNYYGKKYGIEVEAIIGISTEADARTSDVARVAQVIKDRKVPAIFVESTINPKLIKQLADDNGVPIGGELFADSLGEPDTEAGTYIGMIKSNTDVIVSALSSVANNEAANKPKDNGGSKTLFIIIGALLLVLILFAIIKLRN